MGRYGIRLNAIAPGTILTEGMVARLRPGEADTGAEMAKRNPMGRTGTAQDIGDIAAFLLRPDLDQRRDDRARWRSMADERRRLPGLSRWGDAEWAEARERIRARNEADKAQRDSFVDQATGIIRLSSRGIGRLIPENGLRIVANAAISRSLAWEKRPGNRDGCRDADQHRGYSVR
jgi:hypothetical protein